MAPSCREAAGLARPSSSRSTLRQRASADARAGCSARLGAGRARAAPASGEAASSAPEAAVPKRGAACSACRQSRASVPRASSAPAPVAAAQGDADVVIHHMHALMTDCLVCLRSEAMRLH